MTTLTIAAMLGACSSDEAIVDERHSSVEAEEPIEEIVEPIRLGVGMNNSMINISRAALDPKNTTTLDFDLENIGIFMLAAYYQGSTTTASANNINWNRATAQNLQCSPIDNCKAEAKEGIAELQEALGGGTPQYFTQLYLKNKAGTSDSVHYYPVTSKYANRFYGYYPFQEEASGHIERSSVTRKVKFTGLDGKTEILWGRSDVGDSTTTRPIDNEDKKGKFWKYSARFFRINADSAKAFPTIAFKHKLMAFQFALQGQPDPLYPSDPYKKANMVTVDTIIVKAVPSEATLTVADHKTPNNDGNIKFSWDDNTTFVDLGVIGDTLLSARGEDDGNLAKQQVHNDDIKKIGQRLLLPVPETNGYQFDVYVKLKYEPTPGNYIYFESETPLSIEQLGGSSAKYEEGKVYTVLLQIAGPQEVNIKATLDQWKDAEGDDTITPIEFF